MSDVKRMCMVGAGRVGRLHTRSITDHVGHRAEVTSLVDPNIDLARVLADEYDVGRVCASLDEALTDDGLDGVVITTPTFTHRDLAVAALDAGLAVHLEKPMAMNIAECREIVAAAERAGRQVQLGFMRRFDTEFIAAADLLATGDVGAPMIIKSLTHGPGLPPPWATDIRTSNGMLAEVNSHCLDTVSWFAGAEPVDIHVRVANFKGDERGATAEHFYDTMVAAITFENAALATVAGVCPADYGYDARVEVTCTSGMIQVGDVGPGGFSYIQAGTSREQRTTFLSWRDRFAQAYIREMTEFANVIDGASPRVGLADGERAVALTIAGTYSILDGGTVKLAELDPDEVPPWQTALAGEAPA
ncbi:MAG: Gfo/Idh/MocA family oxidoreductase [Ilumatobacteraceae bacterium]